MDEHIVTTKNLLHEIIKIFTQIPGEVQVDSPSTGIFTYNVTNKYFSPTSGSTSSGTSNDQNQPDDAPTEKNETDEIMEQLTIGVILQPKSKGFPKRKISLSTKGFSKQNVATLLKNNPESTLGDVLKHILSETGEWRSIKNFYVIP